MGKEPSQRRLLIGATASIAVGAIVLAYLLAIIEKVRHSFDENKCKTAAVLAHPGSILQPVDTFLCNVIPIFIYAFRHPLGPAIMSTLGMEATLVWTVAAIEAARRPSRFGWRLIHVVGFVLASQYLGISVAAPLFWIPAYIYDIGQLNGGGGIPKSSPLPKRAFTNAILSLFTTFTIVAGCLLKSDSQMYQAVLWFNVAPVVIPIVAALLSRRGDTESTSKGNNVKAILGHAGILACLSVYLGMCLLTHIYTIAKHFDDVPENGLSMASFVDLFLSPNFENEKGFGSTFSTHFMMIDLAGLHAALLPLILTESGILSALQFLVLTPILSPGGAAALYFVQREWNFLRTRLGVNSSLENLNASKKVAKK